MGALGIGAFMSTYIFFTYKSKDVLCTAIFATIAITGIWRSDDVMSWCMSQKCVGEVSKRLGRVGNELCAM